MPRADADAALLAHALFWSAATLGCYLAGKFTHRRLQRWWSTPLLLAPLLLIALALALHENYPDYIRQTHWLVALLGPVTVAFAIPLWEQRAARQPRAQRQQHQHRVAQGAAEHAGQHHEHRGQVGAAADLGRHGHGERGAHRTRQQAQQQRAVQPEHVGQQPH